MAGTIYVIDDDDAVRQSLEELLRLCGYEVKTFSSALDFLDLRPAPASGCVVSDVRMPGMTGLELLAHLKSKGSALPVILITGNGDIPLAVEAMRAGAADFIEKPFDHTILVAAAERALRPAEGVLDDGEKRELAARLDALTPRERQVLDGLVAGKPNKAVARELNISPRTVEVYRANVMTKMQASSFSDLVRMAIRANPNG